MNNLTTNQISYQQSSVQKDNFPLGLRIVLLVISLVLLPLNLVSNGFLIHFVKKEREIQKSKTATKLFILAIGITSLTGSSIGLSINIILLIIDFKPFGFCNIGNFVQLQILFLSFALTHHYLASLIWERFTAITQKNLFRIRESNGKHVLSGITFYVITTWSIITADNGYGAFFLENHLCFFPAYEHHFQTPSRVNIVNIVIVTVWETTCNTIVGVTTLLSVKHIRRHELATANTLKKRTVEIDKRRMKITMGLTIVFSIIWVPFGISAALKKVLAIKLGGIVISVFNIISYTSFFVLPAIYFYMDKRFGTHVKNILKCINCNNNQVNPV